MLTNVLVVWWLVVEPENWESFSRWLVGWSSYRLREWQAEWRSKEGQMEIWAAKNARGLHYETSCRIQTIFNTTHVLFCASPFVILNSPSQRQIGFKLLNLVDQMDRRSMNILAVQLVALRCCRSKWWKFPLFCSQSFAAVRCWIQSQMFSPEPRESRTVRWWNKGQRQPILLNETQKRNVLSLMCSDALMYVGVCCVCMCNIGVYRTCCCR